MKRFIDLRGQIIPDSDHCYFAFYDTIVSQFESFGGEQVFDSKLDFLECARDGKQHDMKRYKGLIPKWVPEQ